MTVVHRVDAKNENNWPANDHQHRSEGAFSIVILTFDRGVHDDGGVCEPIHPDEAAAML